MNRDEVEHLREMIVDQIAGLQEILESLERELNNPADQAYDTLDDDLEQAAENALHDR